MTMAETTVRGGSWLTDETDAQAVFTPERLTDEHRLIAQTATEFMEGEVAPATEQLEQKDWALARKLVRRCGELGLLGTDVPESLGGVGLDKVSAVIVGEAVGSCASFATTFGAQTGLAITPLLCFGTDAQQQRYAPGLVSGETVGAYALSESASGSDALGARARATRQPDGSYSLSGEKMWITNGGFADLYIVFAKIDGEQFTAFLVERSFPGVSTGKEEHKLGLHGSSTTPLILQDARVPGRERARRNRQGTQGRVQRPELRPVQARARCAAAARSSRWPRRAATQPTAVSSASRSPASAPSATSSPRWRSREYAIESMLYRTAGLIDGMLQGSHASDLVLASLEEFAIEASILKVASSEMIDFVLDENVQIHGGNGFVRDYPAERHYRDARVNRIFEGTNEINRMLIPGMLAKRAVKGSLPIIAAARRLQDELLAPGMAEAPSDEPLDAERRAVARDEEDRADDPRHGDADIRQPAGRAAGNPDRRRRTF